MIKLLKTFLSVDTPVPCHRSTFPILLT